MKKVILVSGGTRGIGKATATKFIKEDYDVAIISTGRNEELVKEVITELGEFGNIKHYSTDIGDAKEVEDTVEKVIEDFGQIDVLANVAGTVGKQGNHWGLKMK